MTNPTDLTRRLIWFLVCAALLVSGGCGSSSEEDLTPPSLTYDGTGSVTTVRQRHLAGSIEAGATLEVEIDAEAVPESTILVTGEAWTCDIALEDGSHIVSLRASDDAGNNRTLQFVLTYDPLSIESYVTTIADGAAGLPIGGLFDPATGATPVVSLGDEDPGTPAATDGDTWSFDLVNLPEGKTTVTVSLEHPELGPVEKTVTIEVDPDAPLITLEPAMETVGVPSLVVEGRVDPAATAVTVIPTSAEGTALLDPAGGWSATLAVLPVGKTAVTASVTLNGVTSIARGLLRRTGEPPLVGGISPADRTVDVAVTDSVVAAFSSVMDGTSFSSSTFVLSDAFGAVAAVVSYDEETWSATLDPQADLSPDTEYQVLLTNGVRDADGTALPAELSWTFRTAP